ncbi:hypothetical protein SARC_13657 [Sphaeroforma arctica JP610]|uniref:Uncharacterized protein n=1 Tax=Sphaeroforma arctica JP610 TaxID=667725 RepID=A0A0L0FBA6_9EUKA|nr:hypothetical protein SARC_13657 [Sphaeroforma arctica JP610]KNC73786.1 hypothetical protein SARC_13657 [Sphaeroforma arctica JP610]|eukprot:XP_014147688.1 hypothetical protein SARC_13657 [Sphaeroforma arctica JP610]
MGSTVSVLKDTPERAYVAFSVNWNALKWSLFPITTLATVLTAGLALPAVLASEAAIAGVAAIATAAIDVAYIEGTDTLELKFAKSIDLSEKQRAQIAEAVLKEAIKIIDKHMSDNDYHIVEPGAVYESSKQSLSLNQRAYVGRIVHNKAEQSLSLETTDTSAWSGPTVNSKNKYKLSDRDYFNSWT